MSMSMMIDPRKEDVEIACKGPQEWEQTCWGFAIDTIPEVADLGPFAYHSIFPSRVSCIAWKDLNHLKASWNVSKGPFQILPALGRWMWAVHAEHVGDLACGFVFPRMVSAMKFGCDQNPGSILITS